VNLALAVFGLMTKPMSCTATILLILTMPVSYLPKHRPSATRPRRSSQAARIALFVFAISEIFADAELFGSGFQVRLFDELPCT